MNQGPVESAVSVANRPKVQPATIEDLPALTSLVMELFALSDDFTPDREAQERGLALILEQPSRGRIFVVRNETRIIGMVNLLFTISTAMGGFVILMEDVIVHPAHRGQGYGTMLLDQVIEFAKQKDFKRITLLTDKISAESQNFFRKNGFEYSNMIPMRRIISADAHAPRSGQRRGRLRDDDGPHPGPQLQRGGAAAGLDLPEREAEQ